MRSFLAAGALALTVGIASPVFAKQDVDHKFAADAAKDSMAEVQLGQLALKKSGDAQVREFANRMIQDHTQASTQLEAIAKSEHIVLPTEPGKKLQKPMQKLSGLSDKNFDRAYAKAMIEDHQKAVKLFQEYEKKGKNKELREFAQQTLPVLQDHLHMAQNVQSALGGK